MEDQKKAAAPVEDKKPENTENDAKIKEFEEKLKDL